MRLYGIEDQGARSGTGGGAREREEGMEYGEGEGVVKTHEFVHGAPGVIAELSTPLILSMQSRRTELRWTELRTHMSLASGHSLGSCD